MDKHSHLPDPDQLSMVTGIILIAYAVSQYLVVPFNPIGLQLPGLYIPIDFQFKNLVSITVAILAAAGMDWIIASHPVKQDDGRIQHWLLPALSAWVIGIPLYSIPAGMAWWGVFIFGGLLMLVVITSEYITVDPNDNRSTLAGIGLSALSLVLFLVLATSIRASGVRLYIMATAIGLGSMLVCLRVFYLQSGYQWRYAWSIGISLLLVQIATGFHYLPLSPVQFGLLLVGLLNGLLSISESILRGQFSRRDLIEPGIVFLLTGILALVFG